MDLPNQEDDSMPHEHNDINCTVLAFARDSLQIPAALINQSFILLLWFWIIMCGKSLQDSLFLFPATSG